MNGQRELLSEVDIFVEQTKAGLGVKASGRRARGQNDTYELREPRSSYSTDFALQSSALSHGNGYLWKLYPEKAIELAWSDPMSHPLIANYLKDVVEKEGYSVVGIAKDSQEAICLFREHSPRVVCMDIKLKGNTDGVQTARGNIGDVLD